MSPTVTLTRPPAKAALVCSGNEFSAHPQNDKRKSCPRRMMKEPPSGMSNLKSQISNFKSEI
jgi:hypothetical protein